MARVDFYSLLAFLAGLTLLWEEKRRELWDFSFWVVLSFGNSSWAFPLIFLGKFGNQVFMGKARKGKAAKNGKKYFLSFESSKIELKSQWIGIKERILGGLCYLGGSPLPKNFGFIPLSFLSHFPPDLFPSIFKSRCIIQIFLPWISSFQGLSFSRTPWRPSLNFPHPWCSCSVSKDKKPLPWIPKSPTKAKNSPWIPASQALKHLHGD